MSADCTSLRVSRSLAAYAQVLRLGNIVPDFAAQTTQGDMPSWHEWIEGSWAILFSHPADFTVRAYHYPSPKHNSEPNPIIHAEPHPPCRNHLVSTLS